MYLYKAKVRISYLTNKEILISYSILIYINKMEAVEILENVLEYTGKSRSALAKSIGVIPQRLHDIARGQTKSISYEIADKICDTYPTINKKFLLTGEGDMLISEPKGNAEVYVPDNVMTVPVVPYTARAGVMGDYEQIFASDEYEQMLIPQDKVRNGKYLIFTVGGESMEPELRHRDRVLARLVDRSYYKDIKLHIRNWRVWVIVTRTEGILIKQILAHDVPNHTITLHSFNSIYPDFTVDLSDVIDIYNVVELVSRQL